MLTGLIILAVIIGIAYFLNNQSKAKKYDSDALAISTSALETLTPINNCELKEGWYFGSINAKKPGTPDDWYHENEGSRSAKWRAPHEPRGITAEEAAECENPTAR